MCPGTPRKRELSCLQPRKSCKCTSWVPWHGYILICVRIILVSIKCTRYIFHLLHNIKIFSNPGPLISSYFSSAASQQAVSCFFSRFTLFVFFMCFLQVIFFVLLGWLFQFCFLLISWNSFFVDNPSTSINSDSIFFVAFPVYIVSLTPPFFAFVALLFIGKEWRENDPTAHLQELFTNSSSFSILPSWHHHHHQLQHHCDVLRWSPFYPHDGRCVPDCWNDYYSSTLMEGRYRYMELKQNMVKYWSIFHFSSCRKIWFESLAQTWRSERSRLNCKLEEDVAIRSSLPFKKS